MAFTAQWSVQWFVLQEADVIEPNLTPAVQVLRLMDGSEEMMQVWPISGRGPVAPEEDENSEDDEQDRGEDDDAASDEHNSARR